MRRVFFFAVLLVVVLGAHQPARAQDGANLLQNPSFEGGYFPWFGINEVQVAHGWTPWWRERTEDDPPSTYFRPEYKRAAAYNFPGRVRSGDSAQQWFTFHATHVAGMYQQVFNVTPGTRYRFTIWAQVWSSVNDNDKYSTDPAYPNLQVGIDPTGNWDPWSPDVIWSGTYTFFDTWGQLAIEAVARSDVITVFMRSAPNFPVKHNDMYWDDAALVALGPGGSPPTVTAVPPTAVPPTAAVPPTTAPGHTPVPTSPPQPTATCSPPPEDWVTVTVQRGDTLYALAKRHGTTLDAAIAANCLRTTDIYVGQVLWWPPLPATPTTVPVTATSTVTPLPQTETPTPRPSPTDTPTEVPPSATPTVVPATVTPAATATSTVPAPSATVDVTPTSATPSDGGTRPCGTLALSAGIVLVAGVFRRRVRKP